MYSTNRDKFNARADEFADVMGRGDQWLYAVTLTLLFEIAKDSPTVSQQL